MKVLFIYPNEYLSIGIPAGIATLIAVLKAGGHEVSLFDYTFVKTRELNDESAKETALFLPTEYTLEDLVKDDPVQSIEEAFEQHLASFQPDLVCLSAMTSGFDSGIELLSKFKSRLKCKVVVGGVHPTIAPQDAFRPDIVDFICVGEGEEFLLELCECLEMDRDYQHIRNLGLKKKNRIQINELRPLIDLDELPIPDWSAFDRRHLFRPFMGEIYQGSFYVMSRGCPFNCTYCVNVSLRKQYKDLGRYFRYQKPKTTIRQLSYLKEHFNATWFKFADDCITLFSDEYFEELAYGLEPLKINFGCSVRPETITEKTVSLLKRMGCVAMSIGIESGNEKLRKNILNRRMSNDQIKQAISIIERHGIRVSTFNMTGLPGETRDDVFETIRLNKSLRVQAANVYIIYPYPGTEIYKKHKISFRDEMGRIIPVTKASGFALSKMSPNEVEGLKKTFNLYLILPEELWPVVRYAERSDEMGNVIYEALWQYSEKLLVNSRKNATAEG